jgi:hypothetical protein
MAREPEVVISNMDYKLIVVSYLTMVRNSIISVTVIELGGSMLLLTFDWVQSSIKRSINFAVSRNVTFHVR